MVKFEHGYQTRIFLSNWNYELMPITYREFDTENGEPIITGSLPISQYGYFFYELWYWYQITSTCTCQIFWEYPIMGSNLWFSRTPKKKQSTLLQLCMSIQRFADTTTILNYRYIRAFFRIAQALYFKCFNQVYSVHGATPIRISTPAT